ncbi:MAG: PTPA-CTERM sorting domain-containing protein [Chloroflexota bacterium]
MHPKYLLGPLLLGTVALGSFVDANPAQAFIWSEDNNYITLYKAKSGETGIGNTVTGQSETWQKRYDGASPPQWNGAGDVAGTEFKVSFFAAQSTNGSTSEAVFKLDRYDGNKAIFTVDFPDENADLVSKLNFFAERGEFGATYGKQRHLDLDLERSNRFALNFGKHDSLTLSGFKATYDNGGEGVGRVPTPALIPGLIGMGVAALRRKKRQEADEAEQLA